MFRRFTNRARRIVVLAQDETRDLKHDYIDTEHPLLGLIPGGEGAAAKALETMEIKGGAVRASVIEIIGGDEKPVEGHIPSTPCAERVFELNPREALQLGHNYIGTEHLLPNLLKEGEGVAAQVLTKQGMDLAQVHQTVIQALSDYQHGNDEGRESVGTGVGDSGGPKRSNSAILEQFGRNLTQTARENKLNPVIGRRVKMERVVQILSHHTKNNLVLIGGPGVGRTTVVEGLAQVIVYGDVPETIRDKQAYSLDIGSLVTGSRYRDDFEERLRKILKETRTRGNIILFIDKIHTPMGADTAKRSIDTAQMLRLMLAHDELRTIDVTTDNEYRKYIERNAALERHLQPVKTKEPSIDETVEILKGLRDRYGAHHRVVVTDTAIQAAAELTDHYISDRFLPGKAVGLVDKVDA